MKLKEKWGTRVWDCDSTPELVRGVIAYELGSAVPELAEIVGRMLDTMALTDQQKLDIIQPYSMWEITTGDPE